MRVLLACGCLGMLAIATLCAESRQASLAASQKLEVITAQGKEPGQVVVLSEDELNSYIQYDYASEIPSGVRNLHVELLNDYGIVTAAVDLQKLPASGNSSLLKFSALLFKGERELRARCRFVSAGGQGRVDVESVELDGQRLPDFLVEWLISSTVREHLPGFEAGKPFPLAYELRQIRLEQGQVSFIAN